MPRPAFLPSLLAVTLASVNLYPERHSTNVDVYYVVVAGLIYLIWLVSLVLAWRGLRIGVFIAGLVAFIFIVWVGPP